MSDAKIAALIEQKLRAAFAPVFLDIQDDSSRHLGHAGHRGQPESHFTVTIVSEAFTGLSPLQRHRSINDVLQTEIREQIHALSLKVFSPNEYNHR